ncbi:hypothetical protein [Streptomyces sp. KAU_LT]|uniref:PspA/IM30 family protein n=1 Tax=Streptomyces sp. KAU_LT TaxID=3046669 RepID=UPI0024B775D6|nr:hypothetical protein [Streptomyces sp. KAU_LT]MDI9836204.1 hypothetical protein [Streptomyces sp. KAU_LT]
MAALRKWINAHDQSTRAAAEQMARERRAFVEASALRARELNEREARLTKQAEQVNAYVLGVARRLDEALTRNTRLESDLSALTRSYEELAEDHNRLIRETLQERVDRFQRRPVPTTRKTVAPSVHTSPTTDSTPVRTYADPDGGHHPVPPIPLRRIPVPAAHLVDQPQHERPTEGVGGGTA